MASCRIGASNVKASCIGFGKTRACNSLPSIAVRTWIGGRQLRYASVTLSCKPRKSSNVCFFLSSKKASAKTKSSTVEKPKSPITKRSDDVEETKSSADNVKDTKMPATKRSDNVEETTSPATKGSDDVEETKSPSSTSQPSPISVEIETLITQMCNSSIVELQLQLGGFELKLLRALPEQKNFYTPSASSPVSGTNTEAADPKTKSLELTQSAASNGAIQPLVDKAESFAILKSPNVGLFRRCRIIKGKKAPPSCNENQIVKESQVLCFIEQLGANIPVESDVAGEVVKILRKDGEAVGYGDALIAVLPSSSEAQKPQQ